VKIQILGTGCAKCNALAENTRSAADGLGLDYDMVKVTDLAEIASYGVMITPALAIDGEVKLAGKVPSAGELAEILKSAR
jgi:small redox-active disulfide protein 2